MAGVIRRAARRAVALRFVPHPQGVRGCADPKLSARPRWPRSSPGRSRSAACIGSSHREAPKILTDPTADNTDVYAFTAKDAPGSLTVVANWIPFEEPAGGPYFGKLDPEARYYVKIDNTGDGREDVAYRWEFRQRFRNPESFLVRGADRHLGRRSGRQLRPDVRPLQGDVQGRATTSARSGSPRTCRSRPTTSGRRRSPTTRPCRTAPIAPVRGGGKTFVGPADDPFFLDLNTIFDGINIDKPGRPEHRPRQPGRRQGRRLGLQHPRVRAAGARVRGHPRRQVRQGREVGQRRRRRVGHHRAPERVRASPPRAQAPAARLAAGLAARQPADQRGHHPDRPEGQVQPDVARRRPGELRQVRAQPRAGAPAERPVQPRREGDGPDGHRPGAADRRPRADADRVQPGAGRHAEAQPRRAARGDREPLRRAGGRRGRLPERPPARRRHHRHRAARHRRRAAARQPGRQADPARRRRRPQRQAVPVGVPVRGAAHRRVHRPRRSGRSRSTPRSRSPRRRADRCRQPAASSPSPSRSPPRWPCSRSRGATSGRRRARRRGAEPRPLGTDAQLRACRPTCAAAPRARPSSPRPTPEGARVRRPELLLRADGLAPRARARPAAPELAARPLRGTTSAAPSSRGARALGARVARAYPALVDALVELGRYREAERTLQRFVDLRPGLAAYTRVSYFRELHGDLRGAAAALRAGRRRRRRRAGDVAYVQSLLGSIELNRGRLGAARRAFAAASAAVPGYGPAADGRADSRPPADGWATRSAACAASSPAQPLSRLRHRARRAPARGRPARRRAARLRARGGAGAAAREAWVQPRRRARRLRVRPRRPRARPGARQDRVVAGAERELGRCARLGADPSRPSARRPALGAAGAAARLARPGVPLPRRRRRARRRRDRPRPRGPAPGARPRPRRPSPARAAPARRWRTR